LNNKQYVEAFLDYLRYEKALSPMTVQSYQGDLKAFEAFFQKLDNNLTWDDIDADIAREWIVSMMDKGNKATSTQRRLSALKSCFRFLHKKGIVQRNPIRNVTAPKGERTLPVFVRESDMQRLLDSEDAFTNDFIGIRDRLIIETFYETGIRAAELIAINVEDVNTSAMTLCVRGKGNKQRIVPFGERLLHLIYIYIGERARRDNIKTEALFVTKKGERMYYSIVREVVTQKLALVTDQKKRSPHVLRHTFATTMLNHEAGLEAVKELLGHEKLSTTEIYTHTTFEELKKAYHNAHPRA
jgi:integrase/recombinase XerC